MIKKLFTSHIIPFHCYMLNINGFTKFRQLGSKLPLLPLLMYRITTNRNVWADGTATDGVDGYVPVARLRAAVAVADTSAPLTP